MKLNLVLSVIFIIVLNACKTAPSKYIYNKGMIHGAPYLIVYESPEGKDMQTEIDTLLKNYNMIFSVYEKESVISKVNNNEDVTLASEFIACCNKAMEPATEGQDIDVPLMDPYAEVLPLKAEVRRYPLATMSGFILPSSAGPQELKVQFVCLRSDGEV